MIDKCNMFLDRPSSCQDRASTWPCVRSEDGYTACPKLGQSMIADIMQQAVLQRFSLAASPSP